MYHMKNVDRLKLMINGYFNFLFNIIQKIVNSFHGRWRCNTAE